MMRTEHAIMVMFGYVGCANTMMIVLSWSQTRMKAD